MNLDPARLHYSESLYLRNLFQQGFRVAGNLLLSTIFKFSLLIQVSLIHNSLSFGVKFSTRKIEIFFPSKYAILNFGKWLNNYISGFQEMIFFDLGQYWTEKKSSKMYVFVSERHRWAVVGYYTFGWILLSYYLSLLNYFSNLPKRWKP